jgi:hypothetical protein
MRRELLEGEGKDVKGGSESNIVLLSSSRRNSMRDEGAAERIDREESRRDGSHASEMTDQLGRG